MHPYQRVYSVSLYPSPSKETERLQRRLIVTAMPTIRSERVVFDDEVRPATIHVDDGTIVALSNESPDIDLGEFVVLPGLVDSHVHVNEPGRTHWEGFATATRAAAAGGTTTIVDMPLNSIPPTVSADALEVKRTAARGKIVVDVAFWGGLIPGSIGSIDELVAAGVCGFKSFLVDSGVPEFPAITLTELEQGLQRLSRHRVPALLHAEDPASLRSIGGNPRSYRSYLESRPAEGEGAAVRTAADLANISGARVHILHMSSGAAVDALVAGPANLSGETCPHYLTFCADEIADGSTAFKCAPPIRHPEDRDRLWEALVSGDIAMVVSDHSPASADLKEIESGDFARAWGGIGSLQLRLHAVWTGAVQRHISIVDMTRWLARRPAELAGLTKKGSISIGNDADLVVFDPDGELHVDGAQLQHRHPVTPYDGLTLRGSVVMTILRGKVVYDRGNFSGGAGELLVRDG